MDISDVARQTMEGLRREIVALQNQLKKEQDDRKELFDRLLTMQKRAIRAEGRAEELEYRFRLQLEEDEDPDPEGTAGCQRYHESKEDKA